MFKKDFDIDIIDYKYSIDGRRLLINLNYQSQKFCIVNAYAPNNELFFSRDLVLGSHKIPVMNWALFFAVILIVVLKILKGIQNTLIAHRIFLKVYYYS